MPFIADTQLARLGSAVTQRDAMITRLKDQVKSKATQDNAMALGVAAGTAGAFCFIRGKLEDKATGAWNIPGTQIDYEVLAVGVACALALGGGMMGKQFKKYEDVATHAASGLLGHYVGQLARKIGRTGSFSLVAGMLPSPGDGSSSISYRRTQIAAPYSDPIAEALAQSGV